MIARFPGTCRQCGEPINPGDTINFYGRGHVRHADCDNESDSNLEHEDERAGLEPGTLASDIMSQKSEPRTYTYRITRITDSFVWFRWSAYGPTRRALSTKIPRAEFELKYVLVSPRTCIKRDPSF